MGELYLIAHKVYSQPAFDIAVRMECPECQGLGAKPSTMDTDMDCVECDGLGYWWIIPTSGHRAYPYFTDPLQWYMDEMLQIPPMPPDLPDHYIAQAAKPVSLTEILNLQAKPKAEPTTPFPRRL